MKAYLLFLFLCCAMALTAICSSCTSQATVSKVPPSLPAKVIHRITQTPAALHSTAVFLDWIMPLGIGMLIVGVSLLIFMPAAHRLEIAIAGTGGTAFGISALLRISLWAFPVAAWTMVAVVAAGVVLFIYKVSVKVKSGESPVQAVEEEISDLTKTTPAPLVKA